MNHETMTITRSELERLMAIDGEIHTKDNIKPTTAKVDYYVDEYGVYTVVDDETNEQ